MSGKCISIIGGTGNLGVPVVQNLLHFGYKITLIARNHEKAKKIFGKNTNIIYSKADLQDISDLKNALSETEYLYLNLSTQSLDLKIPFAAEREGIANIISAVNPSRIKQIIAISGLGAFSNVHKPNSIEFVPNTIRKQGHRLLKDSGIPYTILHCTWFVDSFVIYQRKNTYSVIGDTKTPIYFTDCFNYSKHLANAIGNSDAFYREFPIQGNKGFTHPEAANRFFKIYNPKTKVAKLPHSIVFLLAIFNKQMKYVKLMSRYFSNYKEELLAEECGTYNILGFPTSDILDYAQKIKIENTYKHLIEQ